IDPSKLRIELYPADVLKRKAEPVDPSPDTAAVAERMIALMHGADGIGLAAPQIGLSWRMFIAHVPAYPENAPDDAPDRTTSNQPDGNAPGDRASENGMAPETNTEPEVYINPVIESSEGAPELAGEGCLSIPGVTGDVQRPPVIDLSWTDLAGNRQRRKASGLLARCWQHELDHLDGVLILDRMIEPSRIKSRVAIRNLERQARGC
ncbi:MAG: peptide deformylase, partial [Planctomycetota bacterium]